ncbi:MAG: GIY-YIG nuclease family protein [Alphaproteobacteria bacterium]|nr:GIY-YIG nuclease family protein [Alphaproteobacteria bacterium]
MKFVYILQSTINNERYYTGLTNNPEKRLVEHNRGDSIHTNKYRPWKLVNVISFDDTQKAFDFERYLKSGSGRAFIKKHF